MVKQGALRSVRGELERERTRADKRERESGLYRGQLREEGIPHLQSSVDSAFGGGTVDATPGHHTGRTPGTPGTEAARGKFFAGEANRLQHAARTTIAQLR